MQPKLIVLFPHWTKKRKNIQMKLWSGVASMKIKKNNQMSKFNNSSDLLKFSRKTLHFHRKGRNDKTKKKTKGELSHETLSLKKW